MPVYLIRAGEHGPVKIGTADDPAKRLAELQVGNHERLAVLRLFVGNVAEEARLHLRFADQRLHGEWFSFSRTMLSDLGLIEIVPEPEPELTIANNGMDGMDRIRGVKGLSARIARDLGINTSAIAAWRRVPAERVPEVERITGIPRHELRPDLWEPPETEAA